MRVCARQQNGFDVRRLGEASFCGWEKEARSSGKLGSVEKKMREEEHPHGKCGCTCHFDKRPLEFVAQTSRRMED